MSSVGARYAYVTVLSLRRPLARPTTRGLGGAGVGAVPHGGEVGRGAHRGGVERTPRVLETFLGGGRVDHRDHLILGDPLSRLDTEVTEGAVGGGTDRGGGPGGHRAGRLDDLVDGAEPGGAERDAGGLVATGGRGERGQQDAGGEQGCRARGDAGHERNSMPGHREVPMRRFWLITIGRTE